MPSPSHKVTVITPAYNMERYLAEAIRSVLASSYGDFEYLIIDDGSTDRTRDIAVQNAQLDERIRVISHEQNRGLSAARNTGLQHAAGEFVAFLDADDIWHKNFLSVLMAELAGQNEKCAGCFAWSHVINEKGAALAFASTGRKGRWNAAQMFLGICPPGNGSSVLLRRRAFEEAGEFRDDLSPGEDSEYWIRVLAKTSMEYMWCVPEHLVKYRLRPDSLSARSDSGSPEYMRRFAYSVEYRLKQYLYLLPKEEQWTAYVKYTNYVLWKGKDYIELAMQLLEDAKKFR